MIRRIIAQVIESAKHFKNLRWAYKNAPGQAWTWPFFLWVCQKSCNIRMDRSFFMCRSAVNFFISSAHRANMLFQFNKLIKSTFPFFSCPCTYRACVFAEICQIFCEFALLHACLSWCLRKLPRLSERCAAHGSGRTKSSPWNFYNSSLKKHIWCSMARFW